MLFAVKLCVKWGSNTSWHIDVHYVNIFTHTQIVKLKYNGICGWGILMEHLWLKWVGQLWQSGIVFWGDTLKEHCMVFRRVPFAVITWPRVSISSTHLRYAKILPALG